eukprot:1329552-Pyramimonas_sp.AAC.1
MIPGCVKLLRAVDRDDGRLRSHGAHGSAVQEIVADDRSAAQRARPHDSASPLAGRGGDLGLGPKLRWRR